VIVHEFLTEKEKMDEKSLKVNANDFPAVTMVAALPAVWSEPRKSVWNHPWGSRRDGPSMRMVVH
jgi:hypothetical protein